MNDARLRAQIQRAKTLCLTEPVEIRSLLWTLATELEQRLPPAPVPSDEVADYAPDWEAPRPPHVYPDWSAA